MQRIRYLGIVIDITKAIMNTEFGIPQCDYKGLIYYCLFYINMSQR